MDDTARAGAESSRRSKVPFETLQPFDLSEELAGRVADLGLQPHLERRHPNQQEIEARAGAIFAEYPSNSLVCWDGSMWHSNHPRELDGERVVLHITFSRLAPRNVENYDHLDAAWLEGKPFELRVMLGREDFLGSTTIARGSAD